MKICLIKVSEVENPEIIFHHIPVGYKVYGDFVNHPTMGEPFWVGKGWHTSPVTEILGFDLFKTKNSIYQIVPITEPYRAEREISIEAIQSQDPVLNNLDYHKMLMASSMISKLKKGDLDSLFNIEIFDPFSVKGTAILKNSRHPHFALYRRLEKELKVRLEATLFINPRPLAK